MVTPVRRTGASLLFETLEGPIRFAVLDWALKAGIFDLCRKPVRAEHLAHKLDLPAPKLLLALRALVAAGFMEQAGGSFHTSSDILPFVASDSPQNMVETLHAMARTRHAGLERLGDLVAGAAAQGGAPLFDDAHWDANHRSLVGLHRALAADVMESCLAGLPEWTTALTLLEIGPGSAVLAQRLLTRWPALRITLFDLPPIAGRIRQATAGEDRLAVMPGNYNLSLPQRSYDIILCSMTLYFHDRGLPALVARLASCLADGGVLVSLHEALTADRTAPSEHVLGRLVPALRQGDVSFAGGEIADAMAAAGLTRPTGETIATPFGRFRLDAARKDP
jgi:demethylspheroidene O-methyltransferase